MVYYKEFDFKSLDCCYEFKRDREGKYISYVNLPFAFDIETTSFNSGDEKLACMYIFMFSLNGTVVYGRTWEEFKDVLKHLKRRYLLNEHRRLIIYVHNLAFEFQFIHSQGKVTEVFARTPRHPIYCVFDDCFEFKCSYFLSGLSLEKTAENLTSIKINKMVGDLDYSLIRHNKTELTETEMQYCEYDVKILHYFILEEMQKAGGNITKIPLTKTGYVRNYCRKYIRENTVWTVYKNKVNSIAPTDPNIFALLHKCFAGGYTHANYIYIDDILEDVASIDFTSSYPAQMIRHKYPMGEFKRINIDELTDVETIDYLCDNYAVIMEISFKNVRAKTTHSTLSRSKCRVVKGHVIDNGRLRKADIITTYFTDVDYNDFKKFYDFDEVAVTEMYYTIYGYLPKAFTECILHFFSQKTELKGVKGKEEEYLMFKGMLNALYGMCVTNPVNDEIVFNDGEWEKDKPDLETALKTSYSNKKNFLVYQWGVWVTAWARHELYKAILEINEDVVYCDTDSVKYINAEKYDKWIDDYNKQCSDEIRDILIRRGINPNLAKPKTNKGEKTPLGEFTREKGYKYFKTLGAKRYAYMFDTKDGLQFSLTVSGLNKKDSAPYIVEQADKLGISPLEYFNTKLFVPEEFTGCKELTYSEEPFEVPLTDYNGVTAIVKENSFVHLKARQYTMSIAEDFIKFLFSMHEGAQDLYFHKHKELAITPIEYDFSEGVKVNENNKK